MKRSGRRTGGETVSLTFLLHWGAAVANWAWDGGFARLDVRLGTAAYAALLALVLLGGGARLALAPAAASTVRVAAIAVDYIPVGQAAYAAVYGRPMPKPDSIAPTSPQVVDMLLALNAFFKAPDEPRFAPVRAELARLYDTLFALSEREARAGAKIVVWAEANALVGGADEPAVIERGRELARAQGIHLYLSLAVLAPGRDAFLETGAMENKIVAIGPDGAVLSTYHKTKLPPGETSTPGDGTIPVVETPWGRVAAVICYDLDSPDFIRQVGRAGADIVLAPSADWRAVAARHASVAELRAVENGFALVRPTLRGLSVATDTYGRTLGSLDFFGSSERVLVAQVPTRKVPTLYPRVGDLVAQLCAAGTVALLALALVRRLARRLANRGPRTGPVGQPASLGQATER